MSLQNYIKHLFNRQPKSRNTGSVPYTNQPIPISDQLDLLIADGLTITDKKAAERELGNISYFRLSEYLNNLRQPNHRFLPDSTIEDALNMYYFDKQLRSLIFQAIQSIEIALRTRMIQSVSPSLGTFWFMKRENFRNPKYYENTLDRIRYEVGRNKEPFILEFYRDYASPEFPPVWKTLEVISFGTLSKLYENLSDGNIKQAVADSFSISKYKFLVSWIQSIAVLRNLCCHHNRVWNRNFVVHPQIPTRDLKPLVNIPDPSSTKLYNFMCILCYMEKQIHPDSTFAISLHNLLAAHPDIDIQAMGFPADWEEEPLWKEHFE